MTSFDKHETGWADLLGEGRLPRFILICLGVWINAADSLVTATIMPSVGADLGGYAYFSWAVAGFLIGAIMAGASAGRLSEIVGLRRATVLSGLVFAGGCLFSALAPNMTFFLIGRVIQGVGSGWISGLAMVAIAFLFPERHLARVFGAVAAVWGVATILGPLLGGVFAELGDWRAVFWFFAAQAVIFSLAATRLLGRNIVPARSVGVAWRQLTILGLAAVALALADISGSPIKALGLAALALAILFVVLKIDARAATHLLPRHVADLSTVGGSGYAAMFALMATSVGFLIYGPAFLQQLHSLSPLEAGYAVAAHAMAWTIAALYVAGTAPETANRWIRAGAACVLAGPILLALTMRDGPIILIILAAATMGAGYGLSSALMNRRVLASLSDEDRAIGSSGLIAVRQTGEAIGAAIAGATANFAGFSAGLSTEAARNAAVWVYVTAIPLALIGLLAAWRMTRIAGVR